VKHFGDWDKTTVGVCGLKTEYWIDIIPEINNDNINSLYAGELVINHLLAKYDNDLFLALKHFKGAKKNLSSVYRTLELYEKIKIKKIIAIEKELK
jgi:hypothetical protein